MGMFDGVMDGLAGGALTAVGSLIGGSSANQKSWDIAMATNQTNSQEAQKTRDWQEQMRKTQYQTAVDDIQKAGLNPMLAYTQGGAGTPAGATATAVPASYRDAITPAIQSGLSAMSNAADVKLKAEQAIATTAQAEVSRTQALANIAETAKKEQDEKTGAAVEQVNRKQLDAISAEIDYKRAATRTTSAVTAKTVAEEKNIKANEAPSGDPYWYRDLKKFAHSARQAWDNKIAPTNKYLQGK